MDALRLITMNRQALLRGHSLETITAEVWEAQALSRAVGALLAEEGPRELREAALALSSPGGRAAEATELPVPCRGDPRAVRLTRAPDVEATLLALAELLGEVGIALVGLACGVYQEALYWASVEAIDAADEARDRVLDMLRALGESSGHSGRGSAAELR
ncbi:MULTISPECIES: DUF6099 family protein [Streptomyces]|uniref:Uncharacterized protein n=1 Tax=Streptomyces odorifer TaxID=53450 RepID=A0A7Y6EZ66_9ACTN|nr:MULTISPECIES: DUF6099 family protein [Streptomyces]NUV34370.1 hypothetical protein [Streptomyces sp. KAI-27]NUV46078.1 hypothetical protein [Streptomyces sp. CAI-78]MBL0777689.1 hypothetical protein [Streptomyces albidoflavus]MBL0803426.1 hypothetical protein [Streptomyces albidoflavus]MBV1954165.1 hypothetical protein [Streptomyces sp. BV333]